MHPEFGVHRGCRVQKMIMQERHINRRQYFEEQAATSRKYYLKETDYFVKLRSGIRVLEVGCGEGGNLLPYAKAGCLVTGMDLDPTRIRQANSFFKEHGMPGTFICGDFLEAEQPVSEDGRYDIVLVHDVIEHINQLDKPNFLMQIRHFMRTNSIAFFGFPAWQMPFGGHQQIAKGFVSRVPFIHLLPENIYAKLLRISGESEQCVSELLSIKHTQVTIELFERLCAETGMLVAKRTLLFVNPHYEQKFGLYPRRLWKWVAALACARNYITTSAFYLLKSLPRGEN